MTVKYAADYRASQIQHEHGKARLCAQERSDTARAAAVSLRDAQAKVRDAEVAHMSARAAEAQAWDNEADVFNQWQARLREERAAEAAKRGGS